MYSLKRINYSLVLLLVMAFSMYGCATVKRSSEVEYTGEHTDEKLWPVTREKVAAETPQEEVVVTGSNRGIGAFPTGDVNSSVILLDQAVPSQSQVGQLLEFTINLTNLTNSKVKDVEVFETLPSGFDVTSSDPMMRGDGGRVSWLVSDLGPRETKTIRVSGTPRDTGDLVFCCTGVEYKLPPICKITTVVQPALRLEKHAPAEVMLCDTFRVCVMVTNTGSGVARNVQLRDSLPSGFRTVEGKTDLVIDVGSLQPGEMRDIGFNIKADGPGTYENYATAVGDGGLSGESNKTTTVVRQPVLKIAKTGPERRYLGRNITYDIVVSNEGDGPAESTVIEDRIPSNTSFLSASGGGTFSGGIVTWNLGTLQPQDSREVSLNLRAESIGDVENCSTVNAVCADDRTACATTILRGIPAILLEVIDVADPIEVGSSETYEIRVTNQGSATGTNISVVCTLEKGTMDYISSDGPTTGSAVGNTVTFAPLSALGAKDVAIWKVNVRAVGAGDVRFTVSLNSDQIDRSVDETESTRFYE